MRLRDFANNLHLSSKAAPERETGRFTWKKEWTFILILFLFFRLLYSLLGAFEASGPNPEPLSSGSIFEAAGTLLKPGAVSHALVNVWFRWDTAWYLKIAAFGYNPQDGTVAFMPLYPWLVRGLGALTGNYLLAALIISNLACLFALLLFYEVALGEVRNNDIALWGIFFLVAFPSSFFLFAAYTDSLFLALVLATWLFARRGNWLAAGSLAALATLCRLQGALLSIVLLGAYFSVDRFERLRAFGDYAIFLPALTFVAYTLWLRLVGLGSIPATLEKFWGIRTVMPWTGFGLFLQRLVGRPRVFIDYADLSLFMVMLVLLVVGLFRLDPALSLYNFLTLSLFFMRGTPPHLLDSFSRYFLTLFPAFIMLAQLAAKNVGLLCSRILRMVLLSASIGLQIFLVMGFLDWRWIA